MSREAMRDMVLVPGGPFLRGSLEFELERPPAEVDVAPFYIDRFPVTNASYAEFCEATGRSLPSALGDAETVMAQLPDHAVSGVTYHDAEAYAAWAGLRLPTEDEWEKAARGSDGRRWPWGDEFDESRALVWDFAKVAGLESVPVTAFAAGASPYGICQLAGGVEEWVSGGLRPYDGGPAPTAYSDGRLEVLRGGSWFFTNEYARCAFRRGAPADFTGFVGAGGAGFRCARDVD